MSVLIVLVWIDCFFSASQIKLYSMAVLLQLSQLGKLVLQCGIDIAIKLIELLVLGNCCRVGLLNLVGTYNSLASLGTLE